MPQKNCDPAPPHIDAALEHHKCPKCGVEMEPIETGMEGPPLQDLQLCPGCYLVMWRDPDGLHVRQGLPVKKGVDPRREPRWSAGEPEEC